MASKRISVPAKHLLDGFRSSQQLVQRGLVRSMTSGVPRPNATLSQPYADAHVGSVSTDPIPQSRLAMLPGSAEASPLVNPFIKTATCTTVAFPSLEPRSHAQFSSSHLLLPLRKDLLHRAVIYEGDMSRQGTASTKWRSEVHGSNRKIRPQKGSGKARLGDKKSPMLKGGGVAFGPKPRDFSTELPQKIYDLAWRTALSYRYRRGELIVTDGDAEISVDPASAERYMIDMLRHNKMGHSNGRTLFVTSARRELLFTALKGGFEAEAKEVGDVDIKNLLELGRIVVERRALEKMIKEHEADLAPTQKMNAWRRTMGFMEPSGRQS